MVGEKLSNVLQRHRSVLTGAISTCDTLSHVIDSDTCGVDTVDTLPETDFDICDGHVAETSEAEAVPLSPGLERHGAFGGGRGTNGEEQPRAIQGFKVEKPLRSLLASFPLERPLADQRSVRQQPDREDISLPFTTTVCCVDVIDDTGQVVKFSVHSSILRKFSYFVAKLDHWMDDGTCCVRMPDFCKHHYFGVLLRRLYSSDAHWLPVDWINALESDVCAGLGALLLAEMLLAPEELIEELATALRMLIHSHEDAAWVRQAVSGINSRVRDLGEVSSFAQWPDRAIHQATVKAMVGSQDARDFLQQLIDSRHGAGHSQGNGDIAILISAWSSHELYMRHTGQHFHSDFFRTTRLPIEGFVWLWKLILSRLSWSPASFPLVLGGFKRFQCLEFNACAAKYTHLAPAGTRRVFQFMEGPSKATIRSVFASFLLHGLRLWGRGSLRDGDLIAALRFGFQCDAHGQAHHQHFRCFNCLRFMQKSDAAETEDVGIVVLRMILCNVSEDVCVTIMSMMTDFSSWEEAFAPAVVRSLSVSIQQVCVMSFSASWLSGPVCAALRGSARRAAQLKLAQMPEISSDQWAFMMATAQ